MIRLKRFERTSMLKLVNGPEIGCSALVKLKARVSETKFNFEENQRKPEDRTLSFYSKYERYNSIGSLSDIHRAIL
jgi:hypothetical protein